MKDTTAIRKVIQDYKEEIETQKTQLFLAIIWEYQIDYNELSKLYSEEKIDHTDMIKKRSILVNAYREKFKELEAL